MDCKSAYLKTMICYNGFNFYAKSPQLTAILRTKLHYYIIIRNVRSFFSLSFSCFFCFAFWLAIILTFYAIFMNACLNSIPWLLNLFQMAVRLQRIVTTQRISKRGKGEHYSRDVEINIGSGRATVSGTMVFLQNQHFVKTLEIYEHHQMNWHNIGLFRRCPISMQ